ncbi:hypothetical protein H8K90_09370 [Winogradskyella echinorum]|uniref:STAS/SEC14 domain-containing protein n=1 Tax=Winogradskyella echinorum TaxID=538189 RepID=A0ABR6Y1G7_9FLAO|nr:hypothetical protein [Winogradskyella echinorum]MBC3846587.1 hypothetical protein [Winogradskyella echinorum]MBC5750935.1 hypothetical protein [Winogradskyella echinorum]
MNNSLNLKNKTFLTRSTNLGEVYLFDNYIITNFNEGVDIDYANFNEVRDIIKNHFEERPFGFIADRKNSYSINLNDANRFNISFPNLKAYAIVVYNSLTERVFEIENRFFTFNRQAFKSIEDAIDWVEQNLPH